MPCDPCPMEPTIRAILAEVQQIHLLLQPKRCTPGDIDLLAKLLPAVAGKFGSSPVRTREILADPAIRATVNGSRGAIGTLLARAADDEADIAGLRVTRACREGNAVCWSIVRRLPKALEPSVRSCCNSAKGG
jgi:hypothetical protein